MKPKYHKTNRLPCYDYNQNGWYFITVCTKDMRCVLSEIKPLRHNELSEPVAADDLGSPTVILTEYGRIVTSNLMKMNEIYETISAEKYIIMPNHVHLLLSVFSGFQGAPRSSPATNAVSNFITAFKKYTNKEAEIELWQRSFYDHIIRDAQDLINHIQYIDENPRKWILGKDEYYA